MKHRDLRVVKVCCYSRICSGDGIKSGQRPDKQHSNPLLLTAHFSPQLADPLSSLCTMVDPQTAAASAGTLMRVMVFIGTQLSPSVLVRKTVEKELEASALLKENGHLIDPEDWVRLNDLKESVKRHKLTLKQTTWSNITKHPLNLLIHAHRYHGAADHYLVETQAVSADSVANAALKSASRGSSSVPTADEETPSRDSSSVTAADEEALASTIRKTPAAERHSSAATPPTATAHHTKKDTAPTARCTNCEPPTPTERYAKMEPPPAERYINVDTPPTERQSSPQKLPLKQHAESGSATSDTQYPTYHSTKHASHSYTTYFRNVQINAGAKAHIILHFGVGDFTVTLIPHQEFPDLPALYRGPIVLSGYVLLVPCNPRPESKHVPDVFIGPGKKGYDMEFSGMQWHLPEGFHMSARKVEDDHALIATDRATVGDVDRLTPHHRAGRR
ncbi:hypothetical protein K466DRAFT_659080 [Polyporus arcularius HHB13444]|uniref:Uncharacterized protein n=1 Tax=Polyporus arcularius HHB13444 TaxID=1314778 RepID=A0A5C3PSI6_9APHY|nr:hypothetical protein K466DRAFT_659080 [Polyporus arcularius HHB13444]